MPIGPADKAESAIAHCRKISSFSDEAGQTTRTFLTAAMRDCLQYFQTWADAIGMSDVGIDAAGNFRAVLPGTGRKRLVIGSHLDTVPHSGAFDGVLGVVMGMLLAEEFKGTSACTLEIVGFSEEEGVRFKRPFIGSIGFVKGLDEAWCDLRDAKGTCLRQAIEDFGIDVASVAKAQMNDSDGYLEFHIEQGPILESLDLSVGVVDGIAGQTRATFEFKGKANHSGTTPMNLRQDAFCASAEWALAVETMGRERAGLVATIGSVEVTPGLVNVIPSNAVLSLDARHLSDDVRAGAVRDFVQAAQTIAQQRNVAVDVKILLDQQAVAMDEVMIRQVDQAVRAVWITRAPHDKRCRTRRDGCCQVHSIGDDFSANSERLKSSPR